MVLLHRIKVVGVLWHNLNEITHAKLPRTTWIDSALQLYLQRHYVDHILIVTNVGEWGVFNRILFVKVKSQFMKQELVLESKKIEARTRWHPESWHLIVLDLTLVWASQPWDWLQKTSYPRILEEPHIELPYYFQFKSRVAIKSSQYLYKSLRKWGIGRRNI